MTWARHQLLRRHKSYDERRVPGVGRHVRVIARSTACLRSHTAPSLSTLVPTGALASIGEALEPGRGGWLPRPIDRATHGQLRSPHSADTGLCGRSVIFPWRRREDRRPPLLSCRRRKSATGRRITDCIGLARPSLNIKAGHRQYRHDTQNQRRLAPTRRLPRRACWRRRLPWLSPRCENAEQSGRGTVRGSATSVSQDLVYPR